MDKIQKVRKDMQRKVSNLITPVTSHPILLLGSKQTKNSNKVTATIISHGGGGSLSFRTVPLYLLKFPFSIKIMRHIKQK